MNVSLRPVRGFVVLLWACCAAAPIWISPAATPAAVPGDTVGTVEYEVYSQALAYVADSLHMTRPLLVEGQLGAVVPMVHWMGHDSMFYQSSGIVLDSGTVGRFLKAGARPLNLQPCFADSLQVVVLSTMEMHLLFAQGRGLESLYEEFPSAREQGLLGINRAVFNADSTLALTYLSAKIEFPRDWGQFMLLRRQNGRWEVAATRLIVDHAAP